MLLRGYTSIGGVHPETAAIKNILAYHGVKAPHTGKPFTEPMLLGIGGGLGAGYILWEFEKYDYPSLVLGFRYRWNYGVGFLEQVANRAGARMMVLETTGKKKAAQNIAETLEAGQPPLIWFDFSGTEYYHHYLLSVGVVYGLETEAGFAMLDHLARKPYRVPLDVLAAARAKVPSYKNRVMVLDPSRQAVDLPAIIRQGIQNCVDYLGADSTSFALPALRKWARLMTDTKNKKSWPNVFREKRGLYGTLRSLYEGILHAGTGGAGLRTLYAEFLEEASPVMGNGQMEAAAAQYMALGKQWVDLAEAALPDEIELFRRTKELLNRRAALNLELGGDGMEKASEISAELRDLRQELNPTFPLSAADTAGLFENIQSRLLDLLEAEKQALAALRKVLEN